VTEKKKRRRGRYRRGRKKEGKKEREGERERERSHKFHLPTREVSEFPLPCLSFLSPLADRGR